MAHGGQAPRGRCGSPRELHARKEDALTYEIENQLSDAAPDLDAAIEQAFDHPIRDDVLRLVFIACHAC